MNMNLYTLKRVWYALQKKLNKWGQNNMEKELLELFNNVYEALDELMYNQKISCDRFHELDSLVKTPLTEIFNKLNKN